MGRRRTAGLVKRGRYWHIDKVILGESVRQSTRTESLEEAERFLQDLIRRKREAKLYGVRPDRSVSEALARYCKERGWNKDDEWHCALLDRWIGHLTLTDVHMGTLQPLIRFRLERDKVKKKTVNESLSKLRAVLNKAAGEWIDENGLTWLHHPPKIALLTVDDKAQPYPLDWDEEKRLFSFFHQDLQEACLYDVNTGLREDVVCQLRWEWERWIPEIGRSVFVVPPHVTGVKNGRPWVVVHNRIAQAVIESRRGKHPEFVFTFSGKTGRSKPRPVKSLYNSNWKRGWAAAGLPTGKEYTKGVHNLRRTFATRLRAVGVPDETRDLLMHHATDRDMSQLYAVATLQELVSAVDRLCEARSIGLTVLRVVG